MDKIIESDNIEESKKFLHDAMKLYKIDKNKCLIFLEKAIELNQRNTDAYYNAGVVYSELNNYEKATEYFEKAFKLSPKNESIIYNLANQYFLSKKYDLALEYFEKVIKKNSRAADALYNAAYIYLMAKKEYSKAIDYFNRVIFIDDINVDARFNLALAYYLSEEKEKSQKAYEALLKIVPDHFPACFNLANLYKELNMRDKARIMFKKYIDLPNKSEDQYSYMKYAINRIKELDSEI